MRRVLAIPLVACLAWSAAAGSTAAARVTPQVAIQRPCQVSVQPVSIEQVNIDGLTDPFAVSGSLRNPPLVEFIAPPFDGATVTDDLGLFASGPLAANEVYNRYYRWAGSFGVTIDNTTTTIHGSVDVGMRASRSRVTLGHRVALQWAVKRPRGYVFDVQRMAPGSSRWRSFHTGTKETLGCTIPKHTGTYQFRARMRKLSSGRHSRYSPAIRVRVVS